jgi:hypothetical protein
MYNWKISNNNKTKIMKELFKIGGKDLIKGAILAALAVVVTGAITILNGLVAVPPVYPTKSVLINLLLTGLTTFGVYILKNFLTNSEGQFAKSEPKA